MARVIQRLLSAKDRNMTWFNNPQKKIQSILKKIKNGQASETDFASLAELLDEQPSVIPETMATLIILIEKDDIKASSSAISALNMVVEKDLGLVANSLDAIVGCMKRGKKDSCQDRILDTLEILLKLCQKYPEKMGIAVSELFPCLGNASWMVREKAYFILAFLAITRPEFFFGRSKELIRALGGLNIDERIYACRLINKIADRDPKIVADTSDILQDLLHYDPNSALRSEAASAMEKLKVNAEIVKPGAAGNNSPGNVEANICIEKDACEPAVLYPPDEKDILNLLEQLNLGHLADKKISSHIQAIK
ncbi:Uncharacterised protein [uncultured archaeon]|nr:Uncharacterised protein [uncultured archaeon]